MNSLILFSSYSSFSLSSRDIKKCFFKYKSKSFGILQNYCKIHAIYFFKKKTCQSILNLLRKKNIQIILGFLAICKKKKIFYFFIFFRFWFGKNSFFFIIKQQKIGLKGVCQTYSLTKKTL
jgi:hypothetical protein